MSGGSSLHGQMQTTSCRKSASYYGRNSTSCANPPRAFGVARFEVLAWLRDRGRDRLVLDEEVITKIAEETTAIEPLLERQREALEHCMKKVPEDQRALLLQAYQPETSIQTVAQGSGRTVPGFYQWLHRMRQKLLDCIRRALTQEVAS
jgi:RNA polymerase sigma-70 factor (ECF subfamily)